MVPSSATPAIIMAHVEGSGMGAQVLPAPKVPHASPGPGGGVYGGEWPLPQSAENEPSVVRLVVACAAGTMPNLANIPRYRIAVFFISRDPSLKVNRLPYPRLTGLTSGQCAGLSDPQ